MTQFPNVPYVTAITCKLGNNQKVSITRLADGKKFSIPYDYYYNSVAELVTAWLFGKGCKVYNYASLGNGKGYIITTDWSD